MVTSILSLADRVVELEALVAERTRQVEQVASLADMINATQDADVGVLKEKVARLEGEAAEWRGRAIDAEFRLDAETARLARESEYHTYCMNLARAFTRLCREYPDAAAWAAKWLNITKPLAEGLEQGWAAPNRNDDIDTGMVLWEGYFAEEFMARTGRGGEAVPDYPF